LETHPAAVELIPRVLVERAQAVPEYARKAHAFGEHAAALLVVEYAGGNAAAARAAADRLHQPGTRLEDAGDQADLWAVRNVGLGLLMSVPGDTKPLSFIEDVSVPVDRLGDYVRRMDRLLAGHDTRGEWYAHASAGCLHLRPLINLKQPAGRAQMRSIAEGALEIVLELGGVLSGEHGDGISHAGFNERLFGPELTQAFRQLKHAFDPNGLLNPGKIISAEGQALPPMDASLRYDASYQTLEWPTVFRFSRQGGLARAIEDCNGAGVCLKADGVMCPSYQALRQEAHSTRGRANALRAAISGRLGPGAMTSEELRGVLDLCLACKGCKAECPSAVDMARIKAEILAYDHRLHGVPLRSRLFGEIARLSQLARPVAGPVNAIARLSITRRLMERLLGISRHRVMPAFAARTFRQWFAGRAGAAQGEPVVLFVDTFVEHNHPQVGRAAVRVLEACGYRVELAPDQVCCGRAMISKGLLDRARQMAAHNLDALFPLAERGVPIVGLEPSCVATLRDEYLDFFPDDPRTGVLAESALLLEELLTIPGADGRRPVERVSFHAPAAELWVHGHCHAKALTGTVPLLEMLRATGARVREIECGCCGMAGSFGYEVEHYDLSMQIGEMQLFPAVRQAASRGGLVVAAGTSCRAQIQDGTGVQALHPAEVLAMAIQDEKP
jgi:Fe-S oxidoreductase